jgi:NAD(P)H-nitrite reductase large subunit
MGITNPPVDSGLTVLTYQDLESYQYRKIVLDGNCLVGAVLVGTVERAGILAGLIRDKVDVTPFREHLLAPDFGFVHLPRELRLSLFSPEGKAA